MVITFTIKKLSSGTVDYHIVISPRGVRVVSPTLGVSEGGVRGYRGV